MEIATLTRASTAGVLLQALELAAGAELAVRVHEAPPGGGRGVISLAGMLLPAQLPEGVSAGQRLTVRVVAAARDEVTLRIQADADGEPAPPAGALARAAGALATSGDARLVQAAVALQPPGLGLPLGNGDVLALDVPAAADEDGPDAEREPGAEGEAAFVLHSAGLGPIAVRLRLAAGVVSVAVAVEPEAEAVAAAAAPDLRERVERATGARASVAVAARPSADPRPVPPPLGASLDAHA
jgi:hypothetical protein